MNIDYALWPIWCDCLEEQGQNTEFLRYCMEYGVFHTISYMGYTMFEDLEGIGILYNIYFDDEEYGNYTDEYGVYCFDIDDLNGVSLHMNENIYGD